MFVYVKFLGLLIFQALDFFLIVILHKYLVSSFSLSQFEYVYAIEYVLSIYNHDFH